MQVNWPTKSRVLRGVFGEDTVFIDTGDIKEGTRWSEAIETGLRGMAALLCVMGGDWVGSAQGRRRIDDSNDWVRREVRTAIELGVPILPLAKDRTTSRSKSAPSRITRAKWSLAAHLLRKRQTSRSRPTRIAGAPCVSDPCRATRGCPDGGRGSPRRRWLRAAVSRPGLAP
jgi:hypothetical protein